MLVLAPLAILLPALPAPYTPAAHRRSNLTVDRSHHPSSTIATIWPVSKQSWDVAQASILDRLDRVPHAHQETCRAALQGRGGGFSQAGQDVFLWRNFWADPGFADAIYIDIGSNHAIELSNTAFLDLCLGWSGVCFEPQREFHEGYTKHQRKCELTPRCVHGGTQPLAASPRRRSAKLLPPPPPPPSPPLNAQILSGSGGPATKDCVSLLAMLQERGLGSRVVGLLSIDIEGLEPKVLRCLPWHEIDVRIVLIETNHQRDMREVDYFFHSHGFVNAATLPLGDSWLDNVYVKPPGGKLIFPRPARQSARPGDPDSPAPWGEWPDCGAAIVPSRVPIWSTLGCNHAGLCYVARSSLDARSLLLGLLLGGLASAAACVLLQVFCWCRVKRSA